MSEYRIITSGETSAGHRLLKDFEIPEDEIALPTFTRWTMPCRLCGCAFRFCEIDHGEISGTIAGLPGSDGTIAFSAVSEDSGWIIKATAQDVPGTNKYKAWTQRTSDENGEASESLYIVFGIPAVDDDLADENSGVGVIGISVTSTGTATAAIGDFAFGGAWPSRNSVIGNVDRTSGGKPLSAIGTYEGVVVGTADVTITVEEEKRTVECYSDEMPVPAVFDYGL